MATQIFDWLWLGDQNDAFNAIKSGFTHVISCMNNKEYKLVRAMWSMHEYRPTALHICIDDTLDTNIIIHFNTITQWLDPVNPTTGNVKVLIHCQAGINRSASNAVMLYCKYMNQPPNTVIRYIRSRRYGILSNNSFIRQIYSWWNTLKNK